jgi:serine/threonine protein kinase
MQCTCALQSLQVLTLNGYGREADIWSVGTIMYLLMRGRLPFDGDSREEIIERTINGSIDTDDEIWRTYSAEAKELLLGLLNKVHIHTAAAIADRRCTYVVCSSYCSVLLCDLQQLLRVVRLCAY